MNWLQSVGERVMIMCALGRKHIRERHALFMVARSMIILLSEKLYQ